MQISNVYVPNEGSLKAKLLLVGESPGEQEEIEGKPFVGPSGQLLTDVLLRHGVTREEVYLANLCNYRPQKNDFANLVGSKQLEQGLAEVSQMIDMINPNVILGLGAKPLQYLMGKYGISRYRGSILKFSDCAFKSYKYVPAYHPAFVVRSGESYPIFDFDIKRAIEESKYPEFNYTKRDYHIEPKGHNLVDAYDKLIQAESLAVDIETTKKDPTTILCIAFSPDANTSYCFPWTGEYIPYIVKLLTAPMPKIFHFGLFDTEVLRINGIETRNYLHDTMCGQQALAPVLPRSLDFITSVNTREPYYKEEGRGEIPSDTKVWGDKVNKNKLYIYNSKDSAVTKECFDIQQRELAAEPNKKKVYEFEMRMVKVAQAIGRSGMLVDLERRNFLRLNLLINWYERQQILDAISREAKGPDKVNVNSNPTVCKLIYSVLKLPEKYETDKKTGERKLKAGEDSIVSNITYCKDKLNTLIKADSKLKWEMKLEALKLILEIRGIRKLLSSYIEIAISTDGRLRATYKPFSTETGRWAAQKYVDKSGCNPQTFPRDPITCRDIDIKPSEEVLNEMMNQINLDRIESENDNVGVDEPNEREVA
jgi:uracil-DNA glycosylase